ncbi:MAG: trypsin-like peptidase domain-containing protein [Mycobacterium sp.]|nr:trypsin-like peptidase domain-containing protein [Mycobacterium sp.]
MLVNPEAVGSQSLLPSPVHTQSDPRGVSTVQVATKVLPSVVALQLDLGGRPVIGSGVILTADGLIMTNNHVLTMASSAPREPAAITAVLNDGRTVPFNVIVTDPKSDIAIGRAQGVTGLIPMPIGSSANLRVGQPVVAVGSPLGLRNTVTVGVVSALDRLVRPAIDSEHPTGAFYAIQTDAAINPGNSGGALVDMNGDLIGLTSAGQGAIAADGSGTQYRGSIGLNFAIPVDHAERIADELLGAGHASHAWLGALVNNDADPNGAMIVEVQSGSPAAAAGLSPRTLVTQVDDDGIASGDALLDAVEAKEPGTRVTLVIVDGSGHSRTVQLSLGTDQGRQ